MNRKREEYNTRVQHINSRTKQRQNMTYLIDLRWLLVSIAIEQHTCRFHHRPCTLHHPLIAVPPRCCSPYAAQQAKWGLNAAKGRCASQDSPKTTTSLEANGNTSQTSKLHIPSSNVVLGGSLRGDDGSDGSPLDNWFAITMKKESIDVAEALTISTFQTTTATNHQCHPHPWSREEVDARQVEDLGLDQVSKMSRN
jgi:hypothetical protein